MRHINLIGLLAVTAHAAASAGTVKPPTKVVPLIGPQFLSNFIPTGSHAINNATEAFPSIIESLFNNGALNKTDLVFSINVFSAATNASLFSYHHIGEGQEQVLTAGKLDDQTIARTGSVSKLFTVYALLVKAGIEVFDKPVTDYLPELRGASPVGEEGYLWNHVRWEEITIGALASHQAGSGGIGSLFQEHVGEEESITPSGEQDSLDSETINRQLDLTRNFCRLTHSHARGQASSGIIVPKRCILRRWIRSPGRSARSHLRPELWRRNPGRPLQTLGHGAHLRRCAAW